MDIKHIQRRILGYIAGFILFFAPFALFQRSLIYLFDLSGYNPTIHNLCLRIPIEHFLDGRFWAMRPIAFWGTSLLLLTAFFFGPLFCGFLCPSGAAGEFLSKALPADYKVNWSGHLPVTPVRYGFLFGFLLAPFTGGLIACAYCNFYIFDLIFNYLLWGYIVSFSSSMILTAILWIVVLGLFTQGGRGFCLFFCPVGAMQNFAHYLGGFTGLARRISINEADCRQCAECVKNCPMTALSLSGGVLDFNRHICITCMTCVNSCPAGNIKYKTMKEADIHV